MSHIIKKLTAVSLGVMVIGGVAATRVMAVPSPTAAAGAGAVSAVPDFGLDPSVPEGLSPEGREEPAVDGTVTVAGTNYGGPIERRFIMSRANYWLEQHVPYDSNHSAWDVNHGRRYRQDCSGFVSMAWALTSSRTTDTLPNVSTRISWSSLLPGDAVIVHGAHPHAMLFEKWGDSAKTWFWVIEESNSRDDMKHAHFSVSGLRNGGYAPYRYKNAR